MSYEIMVTVVSKPVEEIEMNESNTPIKSDDVILLLFVTGGGRFSLDALLRRRKRPGR